ncbi:MAG TPA: methyltransferase domain-containing protein [Pirellulales bacterium]|jgi:SAM-dependent methyltransferase|nr:methyltransferase domain-containing protein [Pirellulales bacterium]
MIALNTAAASAAGSAAPSARPLVGGDFRCVARNGFGDGNNSYAYSSVWYRDHLYVGSNRHILPLLILRLPFEANFDIPPVPAPRDYTDLDLRGQIWRYNPRSDIWDRVYQAPLVAGYEGRRVPQAFGFRGMTVFQGKSDPCPSIYTMPFVGRNVLESVTLRSTDGERFEALPAPKVSGLPTVFGSFRSMISFKGRMFVAPSSSKPSAKAERVVDGKEVHVTLANTSRETAVLCTDDPASGEWQLSSAPLFGDRTNTNIMDMAVCGDYLYTGATSALHGFQLWRSKADGPPPHHWEKVIDRGADRGAYNQVALSMSEFQGALYVGTCVQNGGYDQLYNIGPAASELLRVWPDNSWDLIVGDPRISRQGLKIPTSGLRAGFNNPLACYFWRMCVHEGGLYVGTCDLSSFVPYSKMKIWPEHLKRMLQPEQMNRYMEALGGCEIWRTTDGDNWSPVTRNGFGNRYNLGVRAMVSTPHGLFIGTANPFGAQAAVRTATGWKYEENPRGGVEVWLGSTDQATLAPLTRGAGSLERLLPDDRGRLNGLGSPRVSALKPPLSSAATRTEADPEMASRAETPWYRKTAAQYRLEPTLSAEPAAADPVLRLASNPRDLLGLNEGIEEVVDEYFGGPLRNVGYWASREATPYLACRRLLEELVGLLPTEIATGAIRQVHGVSASPAAFSAELQTRLPAAEVVSHSWSEFAQAASNSCDLVVAVEPPCTDRARTLAELSRVVRPGGYLLLADGFVEMADRDLDPRDIAGGPFQIIGFQITGSQADRTIAQGKVGHHERGNQELSNRELDNREMAHGQSDRAPADPTDLGDATPQHGRIRGHDAPPRLTQTEVARVATASESKQQLALVRDALALAGLEAVHLVDVTAQTWAAYFQHCRNYWLVKLLFRQLDPDTHRALLASLPGGAAGMHGYFLLSAIKPLDGNSP